MSAMTIDKRLQQAGTIGSVIRRAPRETANVLRLIRTRKRSTLDIRLPWLPFTVIDMLSEAIGQESRVFEYGGGGSTAWFADHAGQVVTVEHDKAWYKALLSATSDFDNVEVIWAENLADYVATIDQHGEELFDVVVIDGRERVACVERAMPRVKPGGFLILDDSTRSKYARASSLLEDWSRRDYFGFVPCKDEPGDTTIWTRPSSTAKPGSTGDDNEIP
jgi:predicted O-methyltransferase YrrM